MVGGYWVWSKLIENLADIGYDPGTAIAHALSAIAYAMRGTDVVSGGSRLCTVWY